MCLQNIYGVISFKRSTIGNHQGFIIFFPENNLFHLFIDSKIPVFSDSGMSLSEQEINMEDSIGLSSKLCSIICSTGPSNKIELVQKQLQLGAELNFRDANRNGNTPLHCSVECEEIAIVEYLLQSKASRAIRNNENLTALDIAKQKKNSDIIRLFKKYHRSEEPIQTEFIFKCALNEFKNIENRTDDPSFKVLEISTSNRLKDILDLLLKKKFYVEFDKSSHWFITIFSISKRSDFGLINIEFLKKLSSHLNHDKPCVIQFRSNEMVKVYYKDTGCSEFKLLTPCETELNRLFDKSESKVSLSFPKLLQMLLYKNKDLKTITIELTQTLKFEQVRLRLIDWAAISPSDLLTRFLMLFKWDLEFRMENAYKGLHRVFEIACEHGTEGTVKALLDLPFSLKGKWYDISEDKKKLTELRDAKGRLPIFTVYESGNSDVLKCLLKCGVKTKNDDSREIDDELSKLAWENQNFEKLKILLEHDKCFPVAKKEMMKIPMLKKIINKRDKFHKNIYDDNILGVKKFIENKPFKIGFNSSNISALKKAFEEKSYNVCVYLISEGFETGGHEDDTQKYENVFWDNSVCHEKYVKAYSTYYNFNEGEHEAYIYHLLSHSKKKNFKKSSCKIKILEYYSYLSEIPEMELVMKVLQRSKINIIIDMERNNVSKIYQKKNQDVEWSRGMHNILTNEIFIGANGEFKKVSGTLAHELTHMAMQVCFSNETNPYEKFSKNKGQFEGIIERVEKSNPDDDIVREAFQPFYKERSECACELIVRVNHLLADNPKNRKQYESKYKELFDFYKKEVSPKLEAHIRNPSEAEFRLKIRNKNDSLQHLSKLIAEKDYIFEGPLEFLDIYNYNIHIVYSEIPYLTVLEIFNFYLKKKEQDLAALSGSILFANVSDLEKNSECKDIITLGKNDGMERIILESDAPFTDTKWFSFLENFKMNKKVKIIIVFGLLGKLKKFSGKNFILKVGLKAGLSIIEHEKEFRYSWNNVSDQIKKKRLDIKVNFQGYEGTLGKVLTDNAQIRTELLDKLEVNLLFEKDKLYIGLEKNLPFDDDAKIFIDRVLKRDHLELCTKNVNQMFEAAIEEKIMIISDDPGMGKSILLTHLAREFKQIRPQYWVIQISLNADIINAFEAGLTEDHDRNCTYFMQFIELKTQFEKEFFRSMYDEKKILIFIDDVNEVKVPEKITLKVIEKLKNNVKYSQLWLATRKKLEKRREMEVQKAYRLEKFTEVDQKMFLQKFWLKDGNIEETNRQNLQRLSDSLISRLIKSLGTDVIKFIGVPLHTRMVAYVYNDTVSKALKRSSETLNIVFKNKIDISKLYKLFLTTKIQMWMARSHALAPNDQSDVIKHCWKIHQLYSVQSHFTIKCVKDLFDPYLFEIASTLRNATGKIGIFYFNRFPKFAHQTYAEYFVADYVVDELFSTSNFSATKTTFIRTVFTDGKCVLVRQFINGIMNRNIKSKEVVEAFGAKVKMLLDYNKDQIIRTIVEENLAEIIKSILTIDNSILEVAINDGYIDKLLNTIEKSKGKVIKDLFSHDGKLFKRTLKCAEVKGYNSIQLKDLENLLRKCGGGRIRTKRRATEI